MARLMPHMPRHGWTAAGIVLGATLLALLWTTGLVLELWNAESSFQLAAWQGALRHAALVVHGVGAWIACVILGRWIAPHAQRMWDRRRQRGWWLGVASAGIGLAVALTGLALLYGPGDWHESTGQLHWWIALGWPALLLLHARRHGAPRG